MNRPADGGTIVGPDGLARCPWAGAAPDYLAYHDDEWGRSVRCVAGLYERLVLEGFQSGLSWITILRKRPAFRAAFAGFVPEVVAGFDDADLARLLTDPRIVRNRTKIEAAVHNARVVSELGERLVELVWSSHVPGRPRPAAAADVPASTPESAALARALKQAGVRFVGPTTAYALLQAVGVVDDHLRGCFVKVGPATGPDTG